MTANRDPQPFSAGERAKTARLPAQNELAAKWAAADPNEDNRRAIEQLIDDDPAGLATAFSGRIAFGTAGLRASLGPGPQAMNAVVVAQTARAISRWLARASLIVVGFDARHESHRFAQVTAAVLESGGHRVKLLAKPAPTPLVAFHVVAADVAAGVVITASHNPATDNGMKIYARSGSQIDDDQAAEIEALLDAEDLTVPPGTVRPVDVAEHTELERQYLDAIARQPLSGHRSLRVAYTPMHGVGGDLALAAMTSAGHDVHVVKSQAAPDPDFPTAAFPNPEEPGALNELLAEAARVDADMALAHDPDADRLAVAIPDAEAAGEWRQLTGDEVGALLADYLLQDAGASGDTAGVVASTIVSSTLAGKIARHHGAHHVTTPTGFKHLSRAGDTHEGSLVFAYEEALGYAVNPRIRDKDGISAALVMLECAAQGPLTAALDRLHERHGVHATTQVSFRFESVAPAEEMAAFVEQISTAPPQALGPFSIPDVDVVDGVIVLRLVHDEARGRICVRPSGTEPKVKVYIELIGDDADLVQGLLNNLGAAVQSDWSPA